MSEPKQQSRSVTFRGVGPKGQPIVGRTEVADLGVWTLERFARGYRSLTIEDSDVEVAGIGRHPDTGRRTWWAED